VWKDATENAKVELKKIGYYRCEGCVADASK
jgi:hypothetical protein